MTLNSSLEVSHLSPESSPANNTKRRLQYPQTPPQKLNKQFDVVSNVVPPDGNEEALNSNDIKPSLVEPSTEKTVQST